MIDNNMQAPQVFLRRNAVEKKTGLSRSRIYALMSSNDFPKTIHLSVMTVVWIEAEIEEWMARHIASRGV